jgi:hypothetical protein
LHRGYHYPRSPETATAARRGVEFFVEEYPDAVRRDYRHYMAVSQRDSLVSTRQYLDFCDRLDLSYREEYPSVLRRKSVDISLRVQEYAVDIDVLREMCWRRLTKTGVQVRLRSPRRLAELAGYDWVVLATYARLNDAQSEIPGAAVDYQYEVCEKPVVRLPSAYLGHSVVIMDGPFMCVDPYRPDGTFMLGNVVHAIHATTVGRFPSIPAALIPYLNRGVCWPPQTKLPAFLADASEFFHDIEAAEHLGSMLTVRTVLPNLDYSDARPTIVRRLDERVLAIFSGKLATCVETVREVTAHITGGIPDLAQRPCPTGLAEPVTTSPDRSRRVEQGCRVAV